MGTVGRAIFFAGLLGATGPAGIGAQTSGATAAGTDATVAQNLATPLAVGAWQAMGTFGFQFQGGRAESRGMDAIAYVAHATHRVELVRLDLQLSRAEYAPSPGSSLVTADDTRSAVLTLQPRLRPRATLIAIGSWRQDRPVGLSHRLMLEAGPYMKPIVWKQFSLALGLLAGVGVQNNARQLEAESRLSYGAIQSVIWQAAKATSVTVFAAEHRSAYEPDDYAALVNTSVTAGMTKHLGLTLSHRYSFESIHPAGTSSAQQTIGAGLTITM